jgi:acyl-ACP thioesterase
VCEARFSHIFNFYILLSTKLADKGQQTIAVKALFFFVNNTTEEIRCFKRRQPKQQQENFITKC